MYQIKTTNKFEKDYKLCAKRGLNLDLLKQAVYQLETSGKLPQSYKTHKLHGDYVSFLECHIQPDWLLIWQQNDKDKIIYLTRTGTHSDLF